MRIEQLQSLVAGSRAVHGASTHLSCPKTHASRASNEHGRIEAKNKDANPSLVAQNHRHAKANITRRFYGHVLDGRAYAAAETLTFLGPKSHWGLR